MSLVVLGTSHKTAKLQLRERWSYQVDEVVTTLENISKKLDTDEVALLSTCNRTEVYCDTTEPDKVINWFNNEINPVTDIDLSEHGYIYHGQDAVFHIMRVASGLDSLVVGEPQILGQFKQAYRLAKKANTIGKKFDKLFAQAFCAAKLVRSDTEIGLHSLSVASVSINIVLSEFNEREYNDLNILLIGSGDTTKTVGRSLIKKNITNLSIANRNQLHAKDLADDLCNYNQELGRDGINIQVKPLDIVNDSQELSGFDAIFTATSSPMPLLTKNVINQSVEKAEKEKLLLIDLAVPRDIETGCGKLKGVYLYTVDDLETIMHNNKEYREGAAEEAEHIIDTYVNEFCSWENSLSIMSSLCKYREQAEEMCQEVIDKAHKRIDAGHDTKEVLVSSLQLLRKKLIHHPTMTLKSLAQNTNEIELLKDLFNV